MTLRNELAAEGLNHIARYYQVIAMNNFLIGEVAKNLGDLLRAHAENFAGVGRRVIREAARKLLTVEIAQANHIALFEFPLHADDADRQQTASFFFHRLP